MSAKVQCPKCKRQQPARTADAIYWCDNCRMQFDAAGDDGGDYSDRDPSARLERQERDRQYQQQRRQRNR